MRAAAFAAERRRSMANQFFACRMADASQRRKVRQETLSEDNWTWSPQWIVAMHYPEKWGFVQFSTFFVGSANDIVYAMNPIDSAKWALRQVYYWQSYYRAAHNAYTSDPAQLELGTPPPDGFSWPPKIEATAHQFRAEITRLSDSSVVWITQDGCCRVEHK